MIDLLVARDLIEQKAITLKWLPNTHIKADVLTKAVTPNSVFERFYETGWFSLVPTQQQEYDEAHRLKLRQGQRKRAKEKKNAQKQAALEKTTVKTS